VREGGPTENKSEIMSVVSFLIGRLTYASNISNGDLGVTSDDPEVCVKGSKGIQDARGVSPCKCDSVLNIILH
jgi:hypothetical protein